MLAVSFRYLSGRPISEMADTVATYGSSARF
jgi:hypothetical protein